MIPRLCCSNAWISPRGPIKASLPLYNGGTQTAFAACLTAPHGHAAEQTRRAGSEINKSSSQIMRLWMCRSVGGFAGRWPAADTERPANLCSTGVSSDHLESVESAQHVCPPSVRLGITAS